MRKDVVLEALRPRSWRESLRVRLVGGWSPVQVRGRLPEAWVSTWKADQAGVDVVVERRLVEEVRTTLLALTTEGAVRRRSSNYGVELRSKGGRAVVVDVFRLA